MYRYGWNHASLMGLLFQFESTSVSFKAATDPVQSLELNLAHPIVPAECKTKVLGTKVEIRLQKREGTR